jgi:hypothetical protein
VGLVEVGHRALPFGRVSRHQRGACHTATRSGRWRGAGSSLEASVTTPSNRRSRSDGDELRCEPDGASHLTANPTACRPERASPVASHVHSSTPSPRHLATCLQGRGTSDHDAGVRRLPWGYLTHGEDAAVAGDPFQPTQVSRKAHS